MNVKYLSTGAVLAFGALLSGCASSPQVATVVPDCTFPDAPEVAAPNWICDAPVEGVEVSAVGSFRKTKAGVQFQKTQATANGRNQLAANMKVHVKQLVKNYTEVTGVGDDETVDTVSSDVSKQITKETLFGTKVFRTRVSPTGTMYVLVGMDSSGAAANAQAALMTSYKNKKAMWQRFMADKAHNELEDEIEKIANQEVD
ncbi:MAG TPA: hypothetical protein ENJ35_09525 [Gammaproteobacteria bacterium]|nr:hypothetical protein [Gammaproteobacteria bacterium]